MIKIAGNKEKKFILINSAGVESWVLQWETMALQWDKSLNFEIDFLWGGGGMFFNFFKSIFGEKFVI